MRFRWKAWLLAAMLAFAFASAAAARIAPDFRRPPAHRHTIARGPHTYIRSLGHGGRIAHGHRPLWATRGHSTGYADLVGDPGSGLGFYPLPPAYRYGAERYRLTHPTPWWHNPVLFAIAADATRYNDWVPGNRDYAYGVFNPNEGVGTPFFGGYYGP
ncbi:MAG TPA: hypothetical protein VLZ74_04180 [Methylocella sp.]|nr:hypothetical protein [Methylocella sp.]